MQGERLARIVKTTYTVIDRGMPTEAQASVMPFGCAYAIPHEPLEDGACEPWVPCAISAEFARAHLADVDLRRIDLTMRWLASPSSRYIVGGYLDVLLRNNEPVTVTVTYVQPLESSPGDGLVIPFHGVIALDLIAGDHSIPFAGAIESSGGGSFTVGRA